VAYILETYGSNPKAAHAVSVPLLELFGIVCGGWQLGLSALVAAKRLAEGGGDEAFYRAKIGTARFYADHVLARAPALGMDGHRRRGRCAGARRGDVLSLGSSGEISW